MARPIIAIVVFKANNLLICLYPRKIKGRLIRTSRIESETFVSSVTNNEIPVVPPSMKRFGNKNPLNPKPAEKIPASRKRNDLILLERITLARYLFFALE